MYSPILTPASLGSWGGEKLNLLNKTLARQPFAECSNASITKSVILLATRHGMELLSQLCENVLSADAQGRSSVLQEVHGCFLATLMIQPCKTASMHLSDSHYTNVFSSYRKAYKPFPHPTTACENDSLPSTALLFIEG